MVNLLIEANKLPGETEDFDKEKFTLHDGDWVTVPGTGSSPAFAEILQAYEERLAATEEQPSEQKTVSD
jgi:hypothetical protein